MSHITLKNGEPSVVYQFTRDEAGAYVQGVAARDLTDEDLAGYSPEQRAAIAHEATKKDGAYKKVGTVPHGLTAHHEPEPDDPPAEPAANKGPASPAVTSGKKGS